MNQQLQLYKTDQKVGFLEQLCRFCEYGAETEVYERNGVSYFVNEFWTARQRQGHRLHEISYRACFKPQLPAFFIDRLSGPGDVVYDPFMGRGTTPLEAALRGRVPFGNDTNPLSVALSAPRIDAPLLSEIETRLDEIPWETFRTFKHDELRVFYHPDTLAQIEGLRAWFWARDAAGEMDHVDRWLRMVAINRLTGHSSGFFSVYTLPPNQAVSAERQARINEKRDQVPPLRNVPAILLKKSKSLLSQGRPSAPRSLFLTGQAEHTPEIADGTVALTVTSPPFLDIVNYEADNWLRCWFLGVVPKAVKISSHRTVDAWQEFVARTLAELARVTRQGGHVAFEVGEVRNGSVRLEEHVIAATAGVPFEVLGVMINQQEFTKTSNCWGVNNNTGGTNSNRIVLLRKSG